MHTQCCARLSGYLHEKPSDHFLSWTSFLAGISAHSLKWNIIAQAPWEHAACFTSISGCFNLLKAPNRTLVPALFLDVVDVLHGSLLHIGQAVAILEFCQPISMFFTSFASVPMFIRPVTMFLTTLPTFPIFIQPVTVLITIFSTLPTSSDPSRSSTRISQCSFNPSRCE